MLAVASRELGHEAVMSAVNGSKPQVWSAFLKLAVPKPQRRPAAKQRRFILAILRRFVQSCLWTTVCRINDRADSGLFAGVAHWVEVVDAENLASVAGTTMSSSAVMPPARCG